MTTFRFVTYCTPDYLIYAINAIESAIKFHPYSKGYIVCAGEIPEYSLKLKCDMTVYELRNLAKVNKAFVDLQNSRNKFEALISIKPGIIMNFLEQFEDSDVLVYLDTDVFFFNSLVDFEQQHLNDDFIVFQHMYPQEPPNYPYGKYNAGLIIIRKGPESLSILREWQRLCIQWCYLIVDASRYADQGYLEELLEMPKSKGIKSTTINVGMHYLWKGPKIALIKGRPFIDGKPLVAFHFHGMKIRGKYLWTGINRYGFKFYNLQIYRIIYKAVIRELFNRIPKNANFELDIYPAPLVTGNPVDTIRRMKKTIVRIPN